MSEFSQSPDTCISNANSSKLLTECATNEFIPTLSDLLTLIKNNHKQQKDSLSRLTEEVISLRAEVRLLRNTNLKESMPQLPLNSKQELQNFEEKLLHNENLRATLRMNLMKIESDGLPYFLRKAIKYIITDELAMKYSWTGTSNKSRIQNYFIIKTIKDVCKEKFPTSYDKRSSTVLQQHFVHAKDRVSRRKVKPFTE